MTKTNRILAALLTLQLLLAAGWAAWSARGPAATASTAWLVFDRNAADKLVIEGPDKARTELARQNGHWVVTQAGDFGADGAQVTQLLARLAALAPGPVVATSAEAAERFKVADAGFERRIAVEAGGKTVATLLLGTSQGARQTYARLGGDKTVVGVDLAPYEVPAKPDDWLDKAALQVPRDDIAAIEVAGLNLVRQAAKPAGAVSAAGAAAAVASAAAALPAAASAASAPLASAWLAQGLHASERLDTAAADKLAAALADLHFNALRGRDDAARKELTKPQLTLALRRRDGQRVDYTLYKLPAGDDFALVLSTRPETFTLASYQAKPLIDAAARATLVPAAAK
jgi:hypothetical protein